MDIPQSQGMRKLEHLRKTKEMLDEAVLIWDIKGDMLALKQARGAVKNIVDREYKEILENSGLTGGKDTWDVSDGIL